MSPIALVTPTSDRPLAFSVCERWMARAITAYGSPVKWYVADDGEVPVHCALGQTYIRRVPCASRIDSFLGNLWAALSEVGEEKILFIEDDDWYAEDYLLVYADWLDQAEIVGESHAKYYSLSNRRYRVFGNAEHASLCQTGIRSRLIPWLTDYITQHRGPFIDLGLWRQGAAQVRRKLATESAHCVGMKGLPGKVGFSEGHPGRGVLHRDDLTGDVLRQWIGKDDADVYLSLRSST